MHPPKLTIRSLMIGIAVMAVAVFAVLRLDIPSLPEQTIWGGTKPSRGPAGIWHDPISYTYLAHCVIPFITIAVVWPRRKTSAHGSVSQRSF